MSEQKNPFTTNLPVGCTFAFAIGAVLLITGLFYGLKGDDSPPAESSARNAVVAQPSARDLPAMPSSALAPQSESAARDNGEYTDDGWAGLAQIYLATKQLPVSSCKIADGRAKGGVRSLIIALESRSNGDAEAAITYLAEVTAYMKKKGCELDEVALVRGDHSAQQILVFQAQDLISRDQGQLSFQELMQRCKKADF